LTTIFNIVVNIQFNNWY